MIRQGSALVYDDIAETAVSHITNESVMGLVLTKVNALGESLGESLAGAVFQLRRNGADFGTVTTGTDGTTSLSGLPAGDYELTELAAPPGYRPLTRSILLHVAAGETMTYNLIKKKGIKTMKNCFPSWAACCWRLPS